MAKDIVYIDIEDEITSVIDKITSSKEKVVALVLPKRTTVFQGAVNMKLLKKTSEQTKKGIVLVTGEEAVAHLAGLSKLYVAKTLNSKPYIPKIAAKKELVTVIDDSDMDLPEQETAVASNKERSSKPVSNKDTSDDTPVVTDEDTIDIDNDESTDGDDEGVEAPVKEKKSKKKILAIPDFSRFRIKFFLSILLVILLIAGSVFAFVIAPKATISIATDSTSFDSTISFTVTTATETLDTESGIVPATKVSIKKTDTDKSPVTGKKDIGEKATGLMTLTNCIKDSTSHTIPAGTSFTTGSYAFVTTEEVVLNVAVFAGSNCLSDDLPSFGAQKTVDVVAAASGTAYNLSARSYSSPISGISAYGSEMTGGTTQEVKAVSQQDIDGAKQRLGGKSKSTAIEELTAQLSDQGKKALAETLSESNTVYKVTPALDAQAEELTVTAEVTYELLGVDEAHIRELLTKNIEKKGQEINQSSIQDDGFDKGQYRLVNKKSNDEVALSFVTVSVLGPKIDLEGLKDQVKGKKRGDIESLIEAIPGVKNVRVEYEPFWVFEAPKSTKKINIVLSEN